MATAPTAESQMMSSIAPLLGLSMCMIRGLGRLISQSIPYRDLNVVRNCVMLLAAMVVAVNFVVDVLYAAIDPRVQVSER